VAAPIPRAAPVTTATLPSNRAVTAPVSTSIKLLDGVTPPRDAAISRSMANYECLNFIRR